MARPSGSKGRTVKVSSLPTHGRPWFNSRFATTCYPSHGTVDDVRPRQKSWTSSDDMWEIPACRLRRYVVETPPICINTLMCLLAEIIRICTLRPDPLAVIVKVDEAYV